MINVALSSRLTVIREGMKSILVSLEDIKIVGEYKNVQEISFEGGASYPDVIVLANPSLAGIDNHLAFLHGAYPNLRAIVVSRFSTVQQVVFALRVGARGLLNASCPVGHLPAAIRAVCSGKVYLHEELSRLVASDLGEIDKDHTHRSLTQRELEIFRKFAGGKKVSEIAVELDISVKTVSTHKARIMQKMGMSSTPQLIQYAIVHQLFEAERRTG